MRKLPAALVALATAVNLVVLAVPVSVDVVEPAGVERGGPADDAVDLVALAQEQLGQVGAVLPCDARDQRALQVAAPQLLRDGPRSFKSDEWSETLLPVTALH
jgi:hypothetical protein